MQKIFLGAVGFLTLQTASAQIELQPLESNLLLEAYHDQIRETPFRNTCPNGNGTAFFDDFSGSQGLYPDCTKWEDSLAFVNNSYAVNPPSMGVVTLDGLHANGYPHNSNANPNISLPADRLTSRPINLSGLTTAYMYFEYQRGGLGERPEIIDSLILEIKNASGTWVKVKAYIGGTSNDTNFSGDTIVINQAAYLHAGFQFRFRNTGNLTGNYDIWNLDYIQVKNTPFTLEGGRIAENDFAMAGPARKLLRRYSAIPFQQIKGFATQELLGEPRFNVRAHYDAAQITGADITGASWSCLADNGSTLISGPTSIGTNTFTRNAVTTITPQNISAFDYAAIDNFSGQSMVLSSSYQFTATFDNHPENNSILNAKTLLTDHYAYDDGVAESRIIARTAGTNVAVEFLANVADTIKGIYIHLPYYRQPLTGQDYINVRVWKDALVGSDTTNLLISDDFVQPSTFNYTTYVDSLNGWWTYAFSSPVAVAAGQKFYVGWEQGTISQNRMAIAVGFDINSTDATQYSFQYFNGNWSNINSPSSIVTGAVMIRPILRSSDVYISPVSEIDGASSIIIYPNPTFSVINIEMEKRDGYAAQLFDITGKMLADYQQVPAQIEGLETGTYFIRFISSDGKLETRKFVVLK